MEIGSMTGPDDIRRSQAAGKGEDRSDELPALPCNFTVAIGAEEVGFCSLSRLSSESVAAGHLDLPRLRSTDLIQSCEWSREID